MIYRTWIELNSNAFSHNIAQLRSTEAADQLGIVIKSDAYGHGIREISLMAEADDRVDWLCTAGLQEALYLRNIGIKKPIIALSYLDGDLKSAIAHNIHCAISNYEDLQALQIAASSIQKQAFVHIKIDTGMARLGIWHEDALEFILSAAKLSHIVLYGIFTHLCDTANKNDHFSQLQLERFHAIVDSLPHYNIKISCTHSLSSSGLSVKSKRRYSLLRAGAFAYGLWKSTEYKQLILQHHPELDLQPVLTWKTYISHIKTIPIGTTVGYNRTFQATKTMRIAVLPVGYGDGYSRRFSNSGIALVSNKQAPIIGIISMNVITIDITDIPDAKLYTEVSLIGSKSPILAHECAQRAQCITNEIMAGLHSSIPRIITDSSLSLQNDETKSKISNITINI